MTPLVSSGCTKKSVASKEAERERASEGLAGDNLKFQGLGFVKVSLFSSSPRIVSEGWSSQMKDQLCKMAWPTLSRLGAYQIMNEQSVGTSVWQWTGKTSSTVGLLKRQVAEKKFRGLTGARDEVWN